MENLPFFREAVTSLEPVQIKVTHCYELSLLEVEKILAEMTSKDALNDFDYHWNAKTTASFDKESIEQSLFCFDFDDVFKSVGKEESETSKIIPVQNPLFYQA